MKSKMLIVFAFLLVALVIAGCSSTPGARESVQESAQMQPAEWNPQVMLYRNADVNIGQYRKVMLLPIEIYTGSDAEFRGVSEQEQQEMAGHLRSDVEKVLKEKNLLATQPGPDIARLRLILAGLQKTRPVGSVVAHALPIGLALNLGKGAMGKSGSLMGTATVGGEFTDSTNGTLIATFLVKEAPNAMDVTAIVSEWDASKKAMDKIAQGLGDRLEKMQFGHR
jgi:predicted small secreted protein